MKPELGSARIVAADHGNTRYPHGRSIEDDFSSQWFKSFGEPAQRHPSKTADL